MTDKKEVQIKFAPGAFDDFEGTQEELDEFIAEIKSMFEGKSPEELMAMGRPVDIDELFEEDPEEAERLINALNKEGPTLQ